MNILPNQTIVNTKKEKLDEINISPHQTNLNTIEKFLSNKYLTLSNQTEYNKKNLFKYLTISNQCQFYRKKT